MSSVPAKIKAFPTAAQHSPASRDLRRAATVLCVKAVVALNERNDRQQQVRSLAGVEFGEGEVVMTDKEQLAILKQPSHLLKWPIEKSAVEGSRMRRYNFQLNILPLGRSIS